MYPYTQFFTKMMLARDFDGKVRLQRVFLWVEYKIEKFIESEIGRSASDHAGEAS